MTYEQAREDIYARTYAHAVSTARVALFALRLQAGYLLHRQLRREYWIQVVALVVQILGVGTAILLRPERLFDMSTLESTWWAVAGTSVLTFGLMFQVGHLQSVQRKLKANADAMVELTLASGIEEERASDGTD